MAWPLRGCDCRRRAVLTLRLMVRLLQNAEDNNLSAWLLGLASSEASRGYASNLLCALEERMKHIGFVLNPLARLEGSSKSRLLPGGYF